MTVLSKYLKVRESVVGKETETKESAEKEETLGKCNVMDANATDRSSDSPGFSEILCRVLLWYPFLFVTLNHEII